MGDFVGGGISEYESRVPWVRHRGDEGGREGDGTQRCIHRQGRGGEAKPDPGKQPGVWGDTDTNRGVKNHHTHQWRYSRVHARRWWDRFPFKQGTRGSRRPWGSNGRRRNPQRRGRAMGRRIARDEAAMGRATFETPSGAEWGRTGGGWNGAGRRDRDESHRMRTVDTGQAQAEESAKEAT